MTIRGEDIVGALTFWIGDYEGWSAGYHAMLDGEDCFEKT